MENELAETLEAQYKMLAAKQEQREAKMANFFLEGPPIAKDRRERVEAGNAKVPSAAVALHGAFMPLHGKEKEVFDAFVSLLARRDTMASASIANLAFLYAREQDPLIQYGGCGN